MRPVLIVLGAALLAVTPLAAQQAQRPAANAPQGLAGSGPITIDADRLEVRDRDKQAIFSGNVVAKRGDALVRASAMTVFYDGETAPGTQARAPAAPGQGQQNIRRIEMAGRVFFQQRDQQATGDSAVYERASETLTMRGNVVLTQGESVINGTALRVNLRTNQAVVEGRVRSILVPNEQANPAAPGVPAPAPAPRR